MKNFFRHRAICTLLVGLLLTAASLPAEAQTIAKKNEAVGLQEALKEMLQKEGAAKLRKATVTVDQEQATAFAKEKGVQDADGSYTVYHGVNAEGKVMGSVLVVNEQGKEGPLQVLVALRPDGKIYDVGFTVFGEDRGKAALTWAYLKQYVGKTPASPVTLGKDIDAITGATWTSTSVANAVKKALVVYDTFIMQDEAATKG